MPALELTGGNRAGSDYTASNTANHAYTEIVRFSVTRQQLQSLASASKRLGCRVYGTDYYVENMIDTSKNKKLAKLLAKRTADLQEFLSAVE